MLPDARGVQDVPEFRDASPECVAWKACYESLLRGFGFGMNMVDLNFHDIQCMSKYSEIREDAGDVLSMPSSAQCSIGMEEEYVGVTDACELYCIAARNKCDDLFESMRVSHQHVLCTALERVTITIQGGFRPGLFRYTLLDSCFSQI
ncbi:hypothetical protein FGB62_275g00 [Gracilaria domingensis]|nr:hypothetical protein FGB62_329g00 [Gracilaria domingensis]KAI0557667.1 hypothetical protein FGB62_275g00 [Gracilaria domingensis]